MHWKKVLTLCSDFQKEFKELQEEFDDELKIAQFSMIMAVGSCLDEAVMSDGSCGMMALIGNQQNLLKLVSEITQKLCVSK